MTTTTEHFVPVDHATLLAQIGAMNVMATSGGRVIRRETGVTLPVSSGYSVEVDYTASDDYTVKRVFKRGAKVWIKGIVERVYCDEVGEAVYQAGCYRSNPFGGHTP